MDERRGSCVVFERMPLGVVFDGELVHTASYLQLDPVPRAAGLARRFVREHTPDLDDEVEDCVLLLTSELVSNAVLHARTPLEVGVVVAQASVLVTVHDLDLVLPLQDPYAEREGGWGLGLVSAMAQAWSTYRHREGGKTVWFRVLRADGHAVADGAAARATSADGARRPPQPGPSAPAERSDR